MPAQEITEPQNLLRDEEWLRSRTGERFCIRIPAVVTYVRYSLMWQGATHHV
jgi:hypothetical protein